MMLLMTAKQIPAPTNTVAPVVSGTTVVGETLSCTTGTWTGSGLVYTYQWREGDGEAIVGATNNTYVLTVAEEGINVYCTVTATNAGGSVSANSNEVGPVTAANPVVASLDFDGSTDYLTQSDANWGSYDRAKFAIIMSFYRETGSVEQSLMARDTNGSIYEFNLYLGSGNNVGFNSDNGNDFWFSNGSIISTNTWYSLMVHFDSANATSGDRVKVWVNNSLLVPAGYGAPNGAVPTSAVNTALGRRNRAVSPSYFDGLIYSAAFVSGTLPAPADVFDGSAGKLKDLSRITGLKSLLTGSTATDDHVLTDWTNNGTVTTSATVP